MPLFDLAEVRGEVGKRGGVRLANEADVLLLYKIFLTVALKT